MPSISSRVEITIKLSVLPGRTRRSKTATLCWHHEIRGRNSSVQAYRLTVPTGQAWFWGRSEFKRGRSTEKRNVNRKKFHRFYCTIEGFFRNTVNHIRSPPKNLWRKEDVRTPITYSVELFHEETRQDWNTQFCGYRRQVSNLEDWTCVDISWLHFGACVKM